MALKRFSIDLASLSFGKVVQTLAAFLALPIVARLLGPFEFGLVAIAMSFVVFTIFLSDAGMGQSLVKTPSSDTATWSSAFWLTVMFGVVLALVLVGIAFAAPFVFGEPRLTPLILGFAILPLIVAALAAPAAELHQRQRFREIAAIDVVSSIAGFSTAIGLAFQGYGAWALVLQQIVFWVVKAVLLIWRTRFRPHFVFRRETLGEHARFARDTIGSTIVYFLGRQIDPLVLARILGATSTGLYAFATRVMNLPHQVIASPVQNALYVRMVEFRQDAQALRDLLLILSTAVAMLVFPAVATLAVASPAYFRGLLSEEWLRAAPVFAWLAPTAAVQTVLVPITAMLLATSRTGVRFRMVGEVAAVWVVALPVAALGGVEVVAAVFTTLNLLYLPRALWLTLPGIGLSVRTFLIALIPATLAAGGICVVHLTLRAMMPMSDLQEIAVSIVELAIAYALLLLACRGSLQVQIKTLRALMLRSAGPAAA